MLDDPRHVPYLMVWKDQRSEKVIEVVSVCAYSRRDSLDWTGCVEVKRTNGTRSPVQTLKRALPRNLHPLCALCGCAKNASLGEEFPLTVENFCLANINSTPRTAARRQGNRQTRRQVGCAKPLLSPRHWTGEPNRGKTLRHTLRARERSIQIGIFEGPDGIHAELSDNDS